MANSPNAEQAVLRIGAFTLSYTQHFDYNAPRQIWIEHSGDDRNGEGGAFSEADLEAVIRAFYVEHF